ncbi:putative histone H2B.3-like [Scophthalmus maximus]|uniref:Putative histone H2B.3-like n=1 Tax=Scophthalmus maximus TaxID=52904 RepID=A0A2U9BBZ7_SCOMX|nr:putative histone H2B.3-like [Scophthalmus maximus]
MKAPVRATRRTRPQTKKRTRAHASLVYRAHKEVRPVGTRSPDFLATRTTFPGPVLLRLVSSEASRLSRSNRLGVVSLQEVNAAIALVQRRIGTRAAA